MRLALHRTGRKIAATRPSRTANNIIDGIDGKLRKEATRAIV